MIIDAAIGALYSLFVGLLTQIEHFFHLDRIPDFNLDAYMDEIDGIMVFFDYAFYLFPFDVLWTCFAIVCCILIFRIAVSVIRTIWEIIPWL